MSALSVIMHLLIINVLYVMKIVYRVLININALLVNKILFTHIFNNILVFNNVVIIFIKISIQDSVISVKLLA